MHGCRIHTFIEINLWVRSRGRHPLSGESSTFLRGGRVCSSETGGLIRPHLPLLALEVDELGILRGSAVDIRDKNKQRGEKLMKR